MFVRQLFGYILAVGIILLSAWWCSRKLGRKYGGRLQTGRRLRILEQIACGPDMRLILLEWEERIYLIGAAPNGMTLLAEKEKKGETEEAEEEGKTQEKENAGSLPLTSRDFKELLKKLSPGTDRKGGDGHG